MHYHVSTVYKFRRSFTADIDGHSILMDTSDDEGDNSGASPKKLMLAALAGCTGIDVVMILEKMKVNFSDFSIDTKATLTEEHPKIYDKVKVIYFIKLDEKDQPKMEKAVRLSKDKYCGVTAMFSAFANIETEIVYLQN